MPIWQTANAVDLDTGTASVDDDRRLSTHNGSAFYESHDGLTNSSVIRPLDLLKFRHEVEHHNRTSFSSVKEDREACISQTFKETRISSYSKQSNEEAVDDGQDHFPPALAVDKSGRLNTAFCKKRILDIDVYSGKSIWKFANLKGRVRSASHGDLQIMKNNIIAPDFTLRNTNLYPIKAAYPAGQAPLEKLPLEIISSIFENLVLDIPPNGAALRNIDLVSLLLTSKAIHATTLPTIYKNVTIPHSTIFRKFLTRISSYPSLGELVRRMDFSHFNPTADGSTVRERALRQNLTPETLLFALQLSPNLQEFLTQEYVDTEIDNKVLWKLLTSLPRLSSLDFCGCSTLRFRDAFLNVVCYQPKPLPSHLSITRLSLHECHILPFDVFEILLPRLSNLTHLDIAHTRVKSHALHRIPETARLTHLNLARCSNLDGAEVVKFLTAHPACESLIYLNLMMEAKSSELFETRQLEQLIPILPSTLRSLNLKGSKMNNAVIKLLLPFSKHLEELGLGRNLDIYDVMELYSTSEVATCRLRYIDISDISARGTMVSDLTNSQLLRPWSIPLEVIELGESMAMAFHMKPWVLEKFGWVIQEAGRRSWLVRDTTLVLGNKETDGGARDWKMGATYWGMRKVPMAKTEVGGMYGHYMFKK